MDLATIRTNFATLAPVLPVENRWADGRQLGL